MAYCTVNRLVLAVMVVTTALYGPADTLYKGSRALVIGYGSVNGKHINWTNCGRSEKAAYFKPPYWVDKSNNCEMTPASFGLTQRDGSYVVADSHETAKYLPGVKTGDQISFQQLKDEVVLKGRGSTVELRSGIASDEDSVETPRQNLASRRQRTLTGCLREGTSAGTYVLSRGKHKTTVLGPDELKRHLGHEVKLSGVWAQDGMVESSESVTAGAKEKREFKAMSATPIADTCGTPSGTFATTDKRKSKEK